jgi:DNA-binding HxlR family transcriptional regulator
LWTAWRAGSGLPADLRRREDDTVPDYGRFCPVALGTEVLADRWTPLILRELILGNTRFNDIARGLPGISRTLLGSRLRHLERKGVLEARTPPSGHGHEYHLTPAGRDLEPVVLALGRWAVEWLFDELRSDDVDPLSLTWWMHRRIDAANLPPGRVVIEFRHIEPAPRTLWIVLDRGEASVCVHHPGFDPDVIVTTTTKALADIFAGSSTWAGARAAGTVRIDGAPRLVRALPRWFLLSPFADVVAERAERAVEVPPARR